MLALGYIPEPTSYVLSSDAGPLLKPKLYTRMARAHMRLGDADSAETAFDAAFTAANNALEICKNSPGVVELELARKGLDQVLTEATLGQSEVSRFRETMNKIIACHDGTGASARSTERERNLEAVGHVKMALSTATGCEKLHEMKVSLLSSLRRWREVSSHCERLAASNTQLDGCFTEDLEAKFPFPGVTPAHFLSDQFFSGTREEDLQGAELKLNSKAAAEAVLRLPHGMMRFYLRALRLEERYPAGDAALRALEKYILDRSGVYDRDGLRSRFDWLPREHNKLTRTKNEREDADDLFRNGEYDRAAAKYAVCLTIDAEGSTEKIDGSSAGGRLHAVLHCNRAACLMALLRFHEAVTECTAALRIHPRYMKALLRRARCYARLERLSESMDEYKRWLEMVEQTRKDPQSFSVFFTPCLFDGPHDMTDDDIALVKQELDEVSKKKAQADADANYRRQKQQWQSNASKKNHSHQQAEAQRRRDYFYSQKSSNSRRWDSFANRGPKASSSNTNSISL